MRERTIYEPTYGQSWALVIGIDAYEHASKLGYARSDAEAVVRLIRSGGRVSYAT